MEKNRSNFDALILSIKDYFINTDFIIYYWICSIFLLVLFSIIKLYKSYKKFKILFKNKTIPENDFQNDFGYNIINTTSRISF